MKPPERSKTWSLPWDHIFQTLMLFKRIEIDPGNNIDEYFIMAHLTTAGACSLGLCLCPLPPSGHSLYCSLRDPVSIQSYPIVPMTSPSVTTLCSESQILILIKSYKALHDLPPWPLGLIPFHSLPLPSTHSSSTNNHISSAASAQTFLITEGVLDPAEKKHSIFPPNHSLTSKNL